MRQLRACMDENIPCEEANCGYAPFSKDEDCIDNLMHRAADAIEELNKEIMALRSDYWDVIAILNIVRVILRKMSGVTDDMAISEAKMKIVIDNYFKSECDVNTSIREAFEKGFRIGGRKGIQIRPEPPKEEEKI